MRKQYQAGKFGIGSYKRVTPARDRKKAPGKTGMRITALILAVVVLVLLFFAVKVKKDGIKPEPVNTVTASVSMNYFQNRT